jgi:hexosaminidase
MDAAAAPFACTASTRLVAGAPARATADLAAAALAPVLGRTLEVADDAVPHPGDIRLRIAGSGAPESYTLTVAATGVVIVGGDEAGLFYGMQTLVQLAAARVDGRIGATVIEDRPRFAYRGAMLDVARHFFPVETVEGFIDRAAALKLNALHLHLTDDQGWRIHIDARPELTATASSTAVGEDPGGFYTKGDYARIVAYAAARHVVVVPEVDAPGHTHAVGLAYPQLMDPVAITDRVTAAVEAFGGELPVAGTPFTGIAVGFSSLRTHDEATYAFLADVYGELAAITPGPYLHVGGDEAHGTNPADYAAFVQRATRIVADLGKTPIAWHEAGSAPGLVAGAVGQYWGYVVPADGFGEKARAFVHGGGGVILSPADAVYLDMKHDATSRLGLVWAKGPTSVERSYRWEPADVIDGVAEGDILGVEAPLWTETVRSGADLDAQAFPRIASAAEIAWSPAAGPQRTWASFRSRVGGLGPLWERQGIAFFRSPEIPWAGR